jgi:hypothetical protein
MAGRARGEVQLVLLDGGVNDVDFEQALDPQGPAITSINRRIEQVFSRDLPQLLAHTRRAFPRAIIVVTGYYSALSEASDRDQLEDLFTYFSGQEDWLIAVNDFNQDVPVWSDVLNRLGLGEDVSALINRAIRRSIMAVSLREGVGR